MSDKNEGTPVTQEWLITIAIGYFIVGPVILLALTGILAFVKWAIS